MQEGPDRLVKVIAKSILLPVSVHISELQEQQSPPFSLPSDWYQPAQGDQN